MALIQATFQNLVYSSVTLANFMGKVVIFVYLLATMRDKELLQKLGEDEIRFILIVSVSA